MILFGADLGEYSGAFLGESFAIDGDRIAAGMADADRNDLGMSNVGVVLLYERDANGFWQIGQRLDPPVPEHAAFFGASLAFAGDQLLVGVSSDNTVALNAGAVRVFDLGPDGTWTAGQKILPIDGGANDAFGTALAVDGDRALIGARGWDATGAAFIYERDADGTWTPAAMIEGPATDGLNRFGEAVALRGTVALIGDRRSWHGAEDAGAAHAYVRQPDGTWTPEAALVPDDLVQADRYGEVVALAGDATGGDLLAVVGAPWANPFGSNSGAAYVWRRDADGGWTFEQKLVSADPVTQDFFGQSVGIARGAIHVGAHGDDGFFQDGSVRVFTEESPGAWTETRVIRASVPRSDDYGYAMASDGERIVVGARSEDLFLSGPGDGAAYVIDDTDLFVLTQNTITMGEFEAPNCGSGPIAYARSYDLAADERTAGGDLEIHCVTSATGGGLAPGIQTLTLYADTDGGAPTAPGVDLVPITSATSNAIYPAPYWASAGWTFDPPVVVPAGTVLVVEVTGPATRLANTYGQSGPTYVRAPDCAIDPYADLASFDGYEFYRWVQRLVVRARDDAGCAADFDGNGGVGFADLSALLAGWGPCPACPADLDGNGTVAGPDLSALLAAWGPCG